MTPAPGSDRFLDVLAARMPMAGAAPFDAPVPHDLMLRLDLDEIARAIEGWEADPTGLASHAPQIRDLGARLIALARP